MGEPFHNIDNVIKAANIMVDQNGLHFSPRKVTVSTSGLVPQLKRFLRESNCALAVSLNATTDEVFFMLSLSQSSFMKYDDLTSLNRAGQKLDYAHKQEIQVIFAP